MNKLSKKVPIQVKEKAPTIMMVGGLCCFAGSIFMASKQTPKFQILLDDKRQHLKKNEADISIKEKAICVAQAYWPAATLAGAGTALIIAAHAEQNKRNAALNAAASLATSSLKDYKAEVVKKLGEEKAKDIQEAVAEKKMQDTPNDGTTQKVVVAGRGDFLCFDTVTSRYFTSNLDKIERARNKINARLLDEMYISLNEWYDALGVETCRAGEEIGWKVDNGIIELTTSWVTNEDTNEPCLILDYLVAPTPISDRMYE